MTTSPDETPTTPVAPTTATAGAASTRRRRPILWVAGAGIAVALLLGGTAVGVAIADAVDDNDSLELSSDSRTVPVPSPSATNDDDRSDDHGGRDVSGADADRASQAALAAVGSGTVTEVERSDDLDHVWEVEVTLADGSDVDVRLDGDFGVVRID